MPLPFKNALRTEPPESASVFNYGIVRDFAARYRALQRDWSVSRAYLVLRLVADKPLANSDAPTVVDPRSASYFVLGPRFSIDHLALPI